MRRAVTIFSLLILTVFMFSLANDANAKKRNKFKAKEAFTEKLSASDCKALYILTGSSIEKHSLPNLQLLLTADLPRDIRGESIEIAGKCGDPTETVLVTGKGKSKRGGDEFILSYSEDLQLISQLTFTDDDDDSGSDDEDSEDDDEDSEDDDDNDDDSENDDDDI